LDSASGSTPAAEKTCSPAAHLNVQIRHRIGALQIDLDFALDKPWTILFGPSGSGKTTILRAIAGLLKPDEGRILSTTMPGSQIENRLTLFDSDQGVFTSAHQRDIRFAPQQPQLFPHMNVTENLLYGIAWTTLNPQQMLHAVKGAREILQSFGLEHLSGVGVNRLSGGEAQRLNLARAVTATSSRMVLLDEPFTGMDNTRRDQLLPYLQGRFAEHVIPVLSVTHDVAEAFQLGAEVIKIADGKVIAQGPVDIVLAEERLRLLQQLNR